MHAAAAIEVPPHGLLPAVDGSWVYLVKRYDRVGRSGSVHVEDFSQLLGANRDTKYDNQIEAILNRLRGALPEWRKLMDRSYFSDAAKDGYREILEARVARLKLSRH